MIEDPQAAELQAKLPEGWRLGVRNFRGSCRSCSAEILWATHEKTGRRSPFDLAGTSHFASCPEAAKWRRSRK